MSTFKMKQIFSMPLPLKIIFFAGLFSPLITLGSVLTGSVLSPDSILSAYGAASNLTELGFVIVATIPSSVIAIFMFRRWKVSLLLFPLGYVATCLSPAFLSLFRADIDHMMSSILSALVIGLLATVYLFLSKEVKEYFVKER